MMKGKKIGEFVSEQEIGEAQIKASLTRRKNFGHIMETLPHPREPPGSPEFAIAASPSWLMLQHYPHSLKSTTATSDCDARICAAALNEEE
jgi:hypothetical protein